jgi:hypothetical protein
LSYTNLFYYNIGHQDFESRWMKPGDEKNTHVPSMVYPINDPNRDVFYAASEIHVAKADHIRLQDISLSYDLPRNMWKKRPGSGVQIYTYMNNVGILWRANKDHLDPDYPSGGFPVPRSYAIGVKAHF